MILVILDQREQGSASLRGGIFFSYLTVLLQHISAEKGESDLIIPTTTG